MDIDNTIIIKAIELQDGTKIIKLVVTGRLYNSSKRFKKVYIADEQGWATAFSINLWIGSVWGIKNNGKKILLKRTYN